MTKLTRQQQWTANAATRRRRILAEGGKVVNVMLQREDRLALDAITQWRGTSITGWVRSAIAAEFKRLKRATPARPDARSTAR